MTIHRFQPIPMAQAEVGDDQIDGAYTVEVTVWNRSGASSRAVMSVDDAAQFVGELQDAIARAHRMHREDHPTSPEPAYDLAGENPIPDDAETLQPDGSLAPEPRYTWVTGRAIDGTPSTGLRDRKHGHIAWLGVVGVEVDRERLRDEVLAGRGNGTFTHWTRESDDEWTEEA